MTASPARRSKTPATALALAALASLAAVTGCATASDATPEEKTFGYGGTTLNVRSHEVSTDLVATDRQDIKVTRWFDARVVGRKETSWVLSDDTLDLQAGCVGIANCDARFRVEVPRNLTVLRDGRETDLKGGAS
ncbi:hypothetical protein ACFVVX_24815 [Kitasatospora sp. NPDC058170]|uniref:hypothetical protein n=1 Tax=Kitasatospora sp. NPDC058170 TaxID=3346364 RepID=UPI0036D7E822